MIESKLTEYQRKKANLGIQIEQMLHINNAIPNCKAKDEHAELIKARALEYKAHTGDWYRRSE